MGARATPVFTTYEQLLEYCVPVEGSSCLRWKFQRRQSRYPYVLQPERPHLLAQWTETQVLVHKLAYDLKYGLPAGRTLRRKPECVHRGCMNPDHYDLW